MRDPAEYLAAIELALVESPVVIEFHVVLTWIQHAIESEKKGE